MTGFKKKMIMLAFISLIAALPTQAQVQDIVDYINPLIGASTSQEAGKSGHGPERFVTKHMGQMFWDYAVMKM